MGAFKNSHLKVMCHSVQFRAIFNGYFTSHHFTLFFLSDCKAVVIKNMSPVQQNDNIDTAGIACVIFTIPCI